MGPTSWPGAVYLRVSTEGGSLRYHPLFLFTDHGDCLAAKLRPGNVSSADDWDELLVPEIDRQQTQGKRVAFRAEGALHDAGRWCGPACPKRREASQEGRHAPAAEDQRRAQEGDRPAHEGLLGDAPQDCLYGSPDAKR